MNWLLNPDDWFGQRPHLCLVIVGVLAVLSGVDWLSFFSG